MAINDSRKNASQYQLAQDIVAAFGRSESGVVIKYSPQIAQMKFYPPSPDMLFLSQGLPNTSSINLLTPKKKLSGLNQKHDTASLDERIDEHRRSIMGGDGITSRSLLELDDEFPGIGDVLNMQKGKIVFIGNGLSSVPLIAASLYESGKLSSPAVVADCFDYSLLLNDMIRLRSMFENSCLKFPNLHHLEFLRSIDDHFKRGILIKVTYYFGTGNIPEALYSANLAINCNGPPAPTLPEQLAIIAVNGQLFNSYNLEHYPLGNFFHMAQLPNRVRERPNFIISRTQ